MVASVIPPNANTPSVPGWDCWKNGDVLFEAALRMNGSQEQLRSQVLDIFEKRKQANPRYSLRAFARQLGTDASYLSKVLSGKRAFTGTIAMQVTENLGLALPNDGAAYRDSFRTISLDSFKLISDWYHFAIFELVIVKGEWNPRTVSRRLGISTVEAMDALGRLQRLGLIKRTNGGYTRLRQGITTTKYPGTHEAFRNLQRQILNQALNALDTVAVEERDQTSMTLAVSKQDLPAAKKELMRMRRRFCQKFQKTGDGDAVYTLSLSFFPVTRDESSGSVPSHSREVPT